MSEFFPIKCLPTDHYELALFSRAVNWKRYWSQFISRFLKGTVAEVGAGIGSNAPFLQNDEVQRLFLIEPDEQLFSLMTTLDLATQAECIHGTLDRVHEQFDTIVYIDVLEHIENDLAETSCAYDHLIHGGHLLIVSPAWPFLYSPFDAAVGHYRRYTRATLRASVDPRFQPISEKYLDSVGLLASLANRLFLRASTPSSSQIKAWDSTMVRASRLLDPIILHALGKTIIGVYQKD